MVINFRDVVSRVKFRSIFRAPSRKFKILANPNVINSPWEVVRAWFRKKSRRSYTLCEAARRVEFRSIFRVPSWKFKILAIPDVLARGKLYEHCFTKKRDGYTLCTKSHVESSFDRFFVKVARIVEVEFRSASRAIMAIPDVLAHGLLAS
ncbi:hypothetical protein BHM03_00051605, partial [Ensete ventricosum]